MVDLVVSVVVELGEEGFVGHDLLSVKFWQPRGKWMVSLVNSRTNATSKRWHLCEIDYICALNFDSRVVDLVVSVVVELGEEGFVGHDLLLVTYKEKLIRQGCGGGGGYSTLQATHGQIDSFLSQLPYEHHLEEVASEGD